jgi:hypothetical protein
MAFTSKMVCFVNSLSGSGLARRPLSRSKTLEREMEREGFPGRLAGKESCSWVMLLMSPFLMAGAEELPESLGENRDIDCTVQ